MTYKFREIKCPGCDHIFMWANICNENHILHRYKLRENNQIVESAKCPKCGMEMAVLEHILEGVDIKDDRIDPVYGEYDGYTYDGYD